jgi:hypothetical protein
MIGGVDTDLPTRAGDRSLEVAVRAVRQHWPLAVFENPEKEGRYDYFWQIPFGSIREIFVYRDTVAADGWDARGAIPELYNTMVHVLASAKTVTVVVDVKDEPMMGLIADIASALRDEEILYLTVRREAA